MQILQIGSKFKVLLSADVDAIDDAIDLIEIKASNPRYWGTKVMLQMINYGSPSICCGIKGENNLLTDITMQSQSEVAADGLRYRICNMLERNIVDGMRALQDLMVDKAVNESYRISFNQRGETSLRRPIFYYATLSLVPLEDVWTSNRKPIL